MRLCEFAQSYIGFNPTLKEKDGIHIIYQPQAHQW
jgi:hypothetical protein